MGDAVTTHPVSYPVRDLQWSEGTEYIIVTTDEMVNRSCALITTASTGNVLPVQQLFRVCWNKQASTMWVVYCGEQFL